MLEVEYLRFLRLAQLSIDKAVQAAHNISKCKGNHLLKYTIDMHEK